MIAKKKITFIGIFVLLVLLLAGCSMSLAGEKEATPTVDQVKVITVIVTQVVPPTNTPVPTNTLLPTATPEPTSTYDPYSVPIYYPLADCAASRLHIGDRAFVTYGGRPNAIRYGSDLHYDTVIGYAYQGEEMEIIDGPYCSYGWIVWRVKTDGGLVGFTPEGNGNEYWLLPVPK